MSHYDYPDDEFDDGRGAGPAPIGVHRAELPAWRSWVSLLAVLILVPILAWGAVKLLGHSSSSSTSTAGTSTAAPASTGAPAPGGPATPSGGAGDSSASASAAPTGKADMSTGITLYNGTSIQGLAGRTGEKLTAAGYTQVNVSPGAYTVERPTKTTVYYNSAEQAATARAVVALLGGGEAVEDSGQAQSNPIVIILREDYPGASENGSATPEDGPNGGTAEADNGDTGRRRGNNR
ncbi:LytR C-terminal domain-containing protein [Actinomyces timonensis]|uniref:LytR C-terminal domain-containing protein n=1 Tax=Actinomyces timonensis TaxID=1288391 RepID=A0AAU8MZB4_9ACTO